MFVRALNKISFNHSSSNKNIVIILNLLMNIYNKSISSDSEKATCKEKGQKWTFPNSRYKYGYIECNGPYWTCYAKNNHHSFDYVPPTDEPTDDGPSDGDDQKRSDDDSLTEITEIITPEIQTVEPEKTPEPAPGPTVDSSFATSASKIALTSSSYRANDEEISTIGSTNDLIFIKTDEFKLNFAVDTKKEPSQRRYISPTSSAEITIEAPSDGDFGVGQIGIHANEQRPNVKIPAATVPLNFYSDKTSQVIVFLERKLSMNVHHL